MIKREETQNQLQSWLDGTLTAEQIWHWALAQQDEHHAQGTAYEDDLVQDIVEVLAALPQDLITLEEAEIMIYGLGNPPAEADLAQNLLWNHLDAIDSEQRRTALADDPFYGEFCGSIT